MKKFSFKKTFVVLGAFLALTATVLMIAWRWNISVWESKSKDYVCTLKSLIPPAQNTVLEERRDNEMPVFSLEGNDFVGILEIPLYESELPVCADWGNVSKYPCRFGGSIYNGTLKVGVTSQNGQYDFYRELSVGDDVFFTDMEGNRYSFKITSLRYEKHADINTLNKNDGELTVFIKNLYAFEYLVVSCGIS